MPRLIGRPIKQMSAIFITFMVVIAGVGIPAASGSSPSPSPVATSPSSPAVKPAQAGPRPYHRVEGPKAKQQGKKRPDFGPDDKISTAWARGELSVDQYIRFSIQRLTRPDRLPERLRSTRKSSESTGLATGYALSLANKASPETRAWLKELLKRPSSTGRATPLSATWKECGADYTFLATYHFTCRHTIPTSPPMYIYYNIQGVSGYWQGLPGDPTAWVPLPGLPAVDTSGNQIPDGADEMIASFTVAMALYKSWGFESTDPDVSVFVGVDFNNNPGIAFPTGSLYNGGPVILLPHDPPSSSYTYLPRHELFHAFQYHYMSVGHFLGSVTDINWWMEATAEWATHQTYLLTNPTDPGWGAYARNTSAFLGAPQAELNATDGLGGKRQYGAFLLAQYLTEQTDFNFVRRTWQAMPDQLPLVAISQVMQGYGRNLSLDLFNFAIANYRLMSPSADLSDFIGGAAGYTDPDALTIWRAKLDHDRPARLLETPIAWGSSVSWSPDNVGKRLMPGGAGYFEFSPPSTGAGRLKVQVTAPDMDATVGFRYLLVAWDSLSSRKPLRWDRADAIGSGKTQNLSVPIKSGEFATLIVSRADLAIAQDTSEARSQPLQVTASLTAGTTATPASGNAPLNDMWARHADRTGYDTMCANWSGGDGTQSVLLPSGRRAWFFSDTYLGDGALRPTFDKSILRNSIVVQEGTDPATATLKTVTGGNTCHEKDTSIPNIEDRYAYSPVRTNLTGNDIGGEYYWSGTGKVLGGNVVWFYLKGKSFEFLNSSMAVIPTDRLDNSTRVNVQPVDLPKHSYYGTNNPIIWGSSIVDDLDGYTYVYGWGVVNSQNLKLPFLARVRKADLTDFNAWRFYKGHGQWTSDGGASGQAQVAPLGTNYTDPMFSVITVNGRHWLVTLDPFSHDMVAYPSTTRYGFSASRVTLYDTPEPIGQGPEFKLIYDLHIHKDLSTNNDSLVASYNVNSTGVNIGCRPEIDYVPKIYRARFVNIPKALFDSSTATPIAAPFKAAASPSGPKTTQLGGRGIRIPPLPAALPSKKYDRRVLARPNTAAAIDNKYYNSWDYQSDADRQKDHLGCPYLPAPTGLTGKIVNPTWGWVELNWDAIGPDVGYKIYQYNVTKQVQRKWPWDWTFGPPRTIGALDDFPNDWGNTYEWYLVPVNIWQQNETTRSNRLQMVMPIK